ncbi:uncharacterized protein LOC122013350 isoform X1 [Zingiber officinale]|uniref:uncharacterized protein LOC122013350 isoform X1 n=1 Tax=Zingiber officinale TaxID=94328 RepID=UPI001C4D825A|nr:uncharacterized protein LOC122013350 isoform X1 [Zingiber officinale]
MGDADLAVGGVGSSSSSEEDGDADWKAAIDSVAAVSYGVPASNGRRKPSNSDADSSSDEDNKHHDRRMLSKAPKLKLYQIKAQKLLDDLLDKSLEMVKSSGFSDDEISQSNVAGIRLFRKSAPGIIVDPVDTYKLPTKKPRILPGEELNEKSKKVLCCMTHLLNFLILVPQLLDRMHEKYLLQFKRKVQSVVVDGTDIMAAATEACRRSLARAEAKEGAAKAAAKKEEERVSALKKARGEKWLPSVAKYMLSMEQSAVHKLKGDSSREGRC